MPLSVHEAEIVQIQESAEFHQLVDAFHGETALDYQSQDKQRDAWNFARGLYDSPFEARRATLIYLAVNRELPMNVIESHFKAYPGLQDLASYLESRLLRGKVARQNKPEAPKLPAVVGHKPWPARALFLPERSDGALSTSQLQAVG